MTLNRAVVRGIEDRQLLWVDVDTRDADRFAGVVAALEIPDRMAERVVEEFGRARVLRYKSAVHLTVQAIEGPGEGTQRHELARRELDILARRNIVVTVHDGPVNAIDQFQNMLHGDTLLGRLDAGGFVEAIIDTILSTYFARVEEVERDIDKLDEIALRGPDSDTFLVEVLRLRRRVALLRRTIAPHREVLAPLARSEPALDNVLGHALPHLAERLERVIDSVENARELLVGSFDIYLGGAAHRSNEVMKLLTILSAVLLPGVVLAGVMGMNFQMPFFDDTGNFWLVVGSIFVFAAVILLTARWRRWI